MRNFIERQRLINLSPPLLVYIFAYLFLSGCTELKEIQRFKERSKLFYNYFMYISFILTCISYDLRIMQI